MKNVMDDIRIDSLQEAKEFKHKFSLSEKSCGNNVSWLNYNN